MKNNLQLQQSGRLSGFFRTNSIIMCVPTESNISSDVIKVMINFDAFAVQSHLRTRYAGRLRQIAELENNWDGYGALALTKIVMDNARRFLSAIKDKGFDRFLNEDDIVPTTYGTIDLDFVTTKGLVSVEIGDNEIGYFTEFNDVEDMSSDGIITDFRELPDEVCNAISKLI